jgi:hypothetical protein
MKTKSKPMKTETKEFQSLVGKLFAGREDVRNKFEEAAAKAGLPFDEFLAFHFQRVADANFLTLSQAAREIGVGVRTVGTWIKQGLPSYKLCGEVRIEPHTLRQWAVSKQ